MRQNFRQLFDLKWSTYHQAALWGTVAVIFYLATTSVEHKVQSTFGDKYNHFLAFGALSFLAHIAYQTRRTATWATALFSYGLLIEVVQYFLPYREFSLLDLATDLLGISVYLMVFYPIFARLLARS